MAKKSNNSTKPIFSSYANSLEEVEQRYKEYNKIDCFPKIAPALLNSADIKAYVKQTGMIYPFYEEDLQSASYKVKIAGKVVYWKYSEGEPHRKNAKVIEKKEIDLKEGESFDLQPNSIAFVTLEPEFRIPKYLALRFNLKITHIYKGLLLGTGPLVDPGFEGRLSIPLHNLTNNTYRFKHGDTLITMEFTKLSPNKEWLSDCVEPGHSESFKFENITSGREVTKYINNALKHDRLDSVISSIPDAVYDSKTQAREARKDVEKVKQHSSIITLGSAIGVFTVVLSSITLSFNAVNKANERYDKMSGDFHSQYSSEIDDLYNKIDSLNEYIRDLEEQINELEKTKAESYDVNCEEQTNKFEETKNESYDANREEN